MVDEAEYKRLQRAHQKAEREAAVAAGEYAAAMRTLREEYNVDTIEAAEALLEDLEAEAKKAEAKYERAKAKFNKEWTEYATKEQED